MVETIFSWLFILTATGLSIYAVVILSKLQKGIEKLDASLNERHSEFQRIWAEQFLEIAERIEVVQGLNAIPGPAGPQGERGPAGLDGADGLTGVQGPQGIQGIQGTQGDPGSAGKDGKDGKDGDPGAAGSDGRGVVDIRLAEISDGTLSAMGSGLTYKFEVEYSDNTTDEFNIDAPEGPRGENGTDGQTYRYDISINHLGNLVATLFTDGIEQGSQSWGHVVGPQGPQGPEGPAGECDCDVNDPVVIDTGDMEDPGTVPVEDPDSSAEGLIAIPKNQWLSDDKFREEVSSWGALGYIEVPSHQLHPDGAFNELTRRYCIRYPFTTKSPSDGRFMGVEGDDFRTFFLHTTNGSAARSYYDKQGTIGTYDNFYHPDAVNQSIQEGAVLLAIKNMTTHHSQEHNGEWFITRPHMLGLSSGDDLQALLIHEGDDWKYSDRTGYGIQLDPRLGDGGELSDSVGWEYGLTENTVILRFIFFREDLQSVGTVGYARDLEQAQRNDDYLATSTQSVNDNSGAVNPGGPVTANIGQAPRPNDDD